MAQPYPGVILAENPRSSIPQNYSNTQSQRPLQEILDENDHLRQMIERIKGEKAFEQQRINQQVEPEGHRV